MENLDAVDEIIAYYKQNTHQVFIPQLHFSHVNIILPILLRLEMFQIQTINLKNVTKVLETFKGMDVEAYGGDHSPYGRFCKRFLMRRFIQWISSYFLVLEHSLNLLNFHK